ASTRSELTISQISAGPSVAALKKTPASGINTISPSQNRVKPSVSGNPGMGERGNGRIFSTLVITVILLLALTEYLIEDAAVVEMLFLHLQPAAKLVD